MSIQNDFTYLDNSGYSVAVFNHSYIIVPIFVKNYSEETIRKARLIFAEREYNESYWHFPDIEKLKRANKHFTESMLSGDTYHNLEMKKAFKQHVESLKKEYPSVDVTTYNKIVAIYTIMGYSDMEIAYMLAGELSEEQLEAFIIIVSNHGEPIFDYSWVVEQVKLPKIFRDGFL